MHDLVKNAGTSEEVLVGAQEILRRFMPWQAERCVDVQLTDELARMAGALTPPIRRPFAYPPNAAR